MQPYKKYIDDLYDLAVTHYNMIDFDTVEIKDQDIIISKKCITEIHSHSFIPTPCIEIKLDIHLKSTNKNIGSYSLYITNENKYLDEFLVIK
jgi:hypothetical protein